MRGKDKGKMRATRVYTVAQPVRVISVSGREIYVPPSKQEIEWSLTQEGLEEIARRVTNFMGARVVVPAELTAPLDLSKTPQKTPCIKRKFK